MNALIVVGAVVLVVAGVFVQDARGQPISDLSGMESGGYGSAGASGLDDAVVDYILNREAAERLRSSAASQFPTRLEMAKRNKFRLCSINAVACFGRG